MGQGAQRFHISETNPNDAIGGGGCACSDTTCADRGGPYAVFHATTTDSNVSPHVVICAGCIHGAIDCIESAERTAAGERVIELPDADVVAETEVEPRPESPVVDDDELEL